MSPIRIATITLVGSDIDQLDRILKDWIEEGFTVVEERIEFAVDLRDKLADPLIAEAPLGSAD